MQQAKHEHAPSLLQILRVRDFARGNAHLIS
jgi:hypothetical protein